MATNKKMIIRSAIREIETYRSLFQVDMPSSDIRARVKQAYTEFLQEFITYLYKSEHFPEILPYRCYFNLNLKQFYKQQHILGDGNCLFHCLRLGIFPSSPNMTIAMIRDAICDNLEFVFKDALVKLAKTKTELPYIGKQKILSYLYADKIISDDGVISVPDMNKYIHSMRQDNKYGTFIEIIVAQILYRRNIFIYTIGGDLDIIYEAIKTVLFSGIKYTNELILYHCNKTTSIEASQHFELLLPNTIGISVNDIEKDLNELHTKQITDLNSSGATKAVPSAISRSQLFEIVVNKGSNTDYLSSEFSAKVAGIIDMITTAHGPTITNENLIKMGYTQADINEARRQMSSRLSI